MNLPTPRGIYPTFETIFRSAGLDLENDWREMARERMLEESGKKNHPEEETGK